MLLFLDQQDDAHADWVEAECDRRGAEHYRFCTEYFPHQAHLSIHITEGNLSGILRTPRGELALEAVTGVWYRRPAPITLHPDLDETFEHFATVESNEALGGLYRALWDRRWVNAPHRQRAANHKIHQLRLARQVGFQTVPTLITNDPKEAQAFFEQCNKRMIYKTMRQVAIAYVDDTALGLYTTLIDEASLQDYLGSIQYVPCLLQQFIPKQYELRINVIGDRAWAAAIHSQELAEAQLDFRPFTNECRHEPALLPPEVERLCVDMTHRLGLRMSNIDMIVTPTGEYIFLELNPGGQWMWIEQFVGFPLCTALVDELLGVDTLSEHPYIKERSLIFEPNTAYNVAPSEAP